MTTIGSEQAVSSAARHSQVASSWRLTPVVRVMTDVEFGLRLGINCERYRADLVLHGRERWPATSRRASGRRVSIEAIDFAGPFSPGPRMTALLRLDRFQLGGTARVRPLAILGSRWGVADACPTISTMISMMQTTLATMSRTNRRWPVQPLVESAVPQSAVLSGGDSDPRAFSSA